MRSTVLTAFGERFGRAPRWLVRAPGRVNLIGEHTDYNDGYVLPMAIARSTWMAIEPTEDAAVELHSLLFNERARFDANAPEKGAKGWIEYVMGVAWALQQRGHHLAGFRGVVTGDVPLGSGLSSSASIEMAAARAFCAASGIEIDRVELAKIGQHAENEWVGVQCGIMDQLISSAGREGCALLVDCRTLAIEHVALPPDVAVVVLDTGTRRRLGESAYNTRRRECKQAARRFAKASLRDVPLEEFESLAEQIDEPIRSRGRHVLTENARVLEAAEALRRGDAAAFGALMSASHASLRDDFAVSSSALDAMVEAALAQPGCLGARMTGAGFGGCAVALVERDAVEPFLRAVETRYRSATGFDPTLYATSPAQGAEVEEVKG